MTMITDKERAELSSAMVSMANLTKNKEFGIDGSKFLSLYWTPEELEIVDRVRDMVDSYQLDPSFLPVKVMYEVSHPVFPDKTTHELMFSVEQPRDCKVAMLWPKTKDQRADADPNINNELKGCILTLVDEAIDRGIFVDVCEWLIKECRHHEQARYLFPPYLALLQRAGLHSIADIVSDIRKTPTPMRTVPPYLMRAKIRHCIQWYGMHQLLGTFEERKKNPVPRNYVEVTLNGNPTLACGSDATRYAINVYP